MSDLTEKQAYNQMVDVILSYYVKEFSIGVSDKMKNSFTDEVWKSMLDAVIKDEFDNNYSDFFDFCFHITRCEKVRINFLKQSDYKKRCPMLCEFLEAL